jgi:hypothetical protein
MAIKSRDSMHSLQRERSRLTREVGRLESTLAAEAERALEAEQRAERMNDLYTVLSFWTTALNQQSDTAQAQVKALREAVGSVRCTGCLTPLNKPWPDGVLTCPGCVDARRALAAPVHRRYVQLVPPT